MEFLEVPLFDDDVYKLVARFSINVLFLTLIVVFAISPNQRDREFTFTAVMLNVIVFFICFTMKKLELDLGLALGLFAVFGVLRYRTDTIRVKDMTYLFVVIGLGVINSLSNKKTSYAEILVVNFLVLATAMLKERIVLRATETSTPDDLNQRLDSKKPKKLRKYTIEYDRLELLGESRRDELLADLSHRTGLAVTDIDVKSIDLLQKKATLVIWLTNESRPSQ